MASNNSWHLRKFLGWGTLTYTVIYHSYSMLLSNLYKVSWYMGYRFVISLFTTGIICKPSFKMSWSREPQVATSFFHTIMSRNLSIVAFSEKEYWYIQISKAKPHFRSSFLSNLPKLGVRWYQRHCSPAAAKKKKLLLTQEQIVNCCISHKKKSLTALILFLLFLFLEKNRCKKNKAASLPTRSSWLKNYNHPPGMSTVFLLYYKLS